MRLAQTLGIVGQALAQGAGEALMFGRVAIACFGLAVFAVCLERPPAPLPASTKAAPVPELAPRVITISTVRPVVHTTTPDVDHAFTGDGLFRPLPQPVAAKPAVAAVEEPRPILASLPPPRDEEPPKAKKQKTRSDFAARLKRYCARPGKTERSWMRLKGVKNFCDG